MQERESNFHDKFRNSFRLNHAENGGTAGKFPSRNTNLPDMPSRTERELRMTRIDELAADKNLTASHLIHLLREKECEVQTLSEELEKFVSDRNDWQDALNEAQTIIEQQQDQLSEFRRRAAQSRTDAEAFKMKNMFLTLGANSRDEQLNALTTACDRLEAEVEALTWQLDQNKRSLTQVQNQRDHLQHQLDETLKWHETVVADQTTTAIGNANIGGTHDMTRPNLSTPTSDGSAHPQSTPTPSMNTISTQPDRNSLNSTSTNISRVIHIEHENTKVELNELRRQLEELREREKEWVKTESRLLDKQQMLEDERQKHLSRIEMLVNAQRSPPVQDTEFYSQTRPASQASQLTDTAHLIEIRRLTEERSKWRSYACGLVRTFVDYCEHFIQRTQYEEPEFHTMAERRWYDYSIYLLEILLTEAPQRLSEADLELLRRSATGARETLTSRNTMTSSMMSINNGPDILSGVTMRSNQKKKLSTSERVAKLARRSLFRPSQTKQSSAW